MAASVATHSWILGKNRNYDLTLYIESTWLLMRVNVTPRESHGRWTPFWESLDSSLAFSVLNWKNDSPGGVIRHFMSVTFVSIFRGVKLHPILFSEHSKVSRVHSRVLRVQTNYSFKVFVIQSNNAGKFKCHPLGDIWHLHWYFWHLCILKICSYTTKVSQVVYWILTGYWIGKMTLQEVSLDT